MPLVAYLFPRQFSVAAGRLAQILLRSIRDNLLAFLPGQVHKACDNGDPVQVIRDDGAVCGTVLPAEERVEDAPTAGTILKG